MISFFGITFGNEYFIYAGLTVVAAFIIFNRNLGRDKVRMSILALRCAAIFALFLVLAVPHTIREESITVQSTSVSVIDDRSDSMSVYDSVQTQELLGDIESSSTGTATVSLTNVTTKDSTAIGDAVYDSILESGMKNNAVILITDGNNNAGTDPIEVASFAARTNTKIFSISPENPKAEIYISGIDGSNLASSGTEYSAKITVKSLDVPASYRLTATIDGETAIDQEVTSSSGAEEFEIKKVFTSEGAHRITAEIFPRSADTYGQNNVFMKTVQIIGKPKILLVGKTNSTPIESVLKDLYDVEKAGSLSSDLGKYNAIVIDDVKAKSLDANALREFLNSGGGIFVIGGKNSYDFSDYYESSLENLLPVKSTTSDRKEGKQVNVVILIDISGSTGDTMSGDTKIDVEKAIAVKMIRDLGDKVNIGLAAFNSAGYLVQSIGRVSDSTGLEARVSMLHFGGGTFVVEGLRKAKDMLDETQGAKYVVLISDGITQNPVRAFNEAALMADDGIIIHSVGVGFDTDNAFMSGLAAKTGGLYFSPDSTQRVKLVIGESDDTKDSGNLYMVLVDKYHFITENIGDFNVSLKDFNQVTAKTGSQVLATTSGGSPLLTVWRLGLGRVASLTVDDGSEWAGGLYSGGNSKIISSTVNWVIGDPLRDNEVRVECADTHAGDESTITVRSDVAHPNVAVGGEEMQLSNIGESTYYLDYRPTTTGFVTISSSGKSCDMAVNYPEEYGKFGTDAELLKTLASTTGGAVYKPNEIGALASQVSQYAADEAVGISTTEVNMQLWFSLVALLLFFTDIIIRRIREIKKSGAPHKTEETPKTKSKGANK